MIFVGYEPGCKGYQFWDTAHHHIKISHDVKFNETLFPVQEATTSWASTNDLPIFQSDNESDTSGLELVIPAQSSPRLPSPGLSAFRPQRSQKQIHPHPLPHQGFHWVCNLLDQVSHLPNLKSPNHNIPFIQLRNDRLINLNPLETILMPFWSICSKRLLTHTKKH